MKLRENLSTAKGDKKKEEIKKFYEISYVLKNIFFTYSDYVEGA